MILTMIVATVCITWLIFMAVAAGVYVSNSRIEAEINAEMRREAFSREGFGK